MPSMLVLATMEGSNPFFHTVQSLPTERNSCRHSKRKLMVLLSPVREFTRKIYRDLATRKIYLPVRLANGIAELTVKIRIERIEGVNISAFLFQICDNYKAKMFFAKI